MLQGSLLKDDAAVLKLPNIFVRLSQFLVEDALHMNILNTLKANDGFLGQVCTIMHVTPATDGESIPFLF